MNAPPLTADERAVSPVIGVILMVAITVVLAAVIGVFALDLASRASTDAPEVDFDYDIGGGSVTITHQLGETVETDRLDVQGATGSWSDTTVSPGVEFTGTVDGGAEVIRVVWQSPDGQISTVIGEVAVP